jgi:hypothetical protein
VAVFGIAVNNRLPVANLSKGQVAGILSGGGSTLGVAGNPAPTPLTVCRLASGSGVQAAANAYFLGNPCGSGGLAPMAVGGGLANYLVVENATADAVRNCLNESFANGSGALGLFPLADAPKPEDRWRFVALDGVEPSLAQAAAGRYPWVAEAAYLWRNVDVLGIPKPVGGQKALIDGIVRGAAEAKRLGALSGMAALPGSNPASAFDPQNPVMGVGGNGTTCPASRSAPSAQ